MLKYAKILRAIWASGIKKLRVLNFFQDQIWFFFKSFISLFIGYWYEPTVFKGHLRPWSEHFVAPHQILRAIGPRARPILTPGIIWCHFIPLLDVWSHLLSVVQDWKPKGKPTRSKRLCVWKLTHYETITVFKFKVW